MTEEQLEMYIDSCCERLSEKQEDLQTKYGLGSFEKYWCDLEQKILQFKNNDVVVHEFDVICLGSLSAQSNTWMWGWANEHFPEKVREDSRKIQELTTILGYDVFDSPVFDCDDEMAYVLTAIACDHLDAIGTYRIPSKNGYLVLGIMDQSTISHM